jgi:hypothetical protein
MMGELMSDDGRSCPDLEQLAEYVDGTSPAAQREALEVHLAGCDSCRELVAEMALAVSALAHDSSAVTAPAAPAPDPSAPVAPGRVLPFRPRTLGLAAALAAAAALIFAARQQPAWFGLDGGAASRLVALQASVAEARPTPGRLSGFDYATYRAPTRGVPVERPEDLSLLAAARTVEEAVEHSPSVANRHAWGVAQLLIRQWDGAVRTLSELARERPTDAAVLNDLAAAYVARGQALAQTDDFRQAVAVSASALQADPTSAAPLFNAALAREALGERERAIEAWRQVLARDTSPWRQEAETRADALTRTPASTP